jgi:nucleoside-diphosphate-sugar epimerase
MDYSHLEPLVSADAVGDWLNALRRPVAVTGGTGFVGSHLVETLCSAGVDTRVLARDLKSPRWISEAPVHWVEGSLEDSDALERLVADAGTVLHLAGVVRAHSAAEFNAGNQRGTAHLTRAVRKAAPSARVVHVSSLAAAGPSTDPDGVAPDVEPGPISDYGRSKLAAELEIRGLGDDVWWTIVRPPAIYGPRDTDVFEFFRMASRGLVALPAGERWVTVAWVGDVVRSILAAAVTAQPYGLFHLGEPHPMRLGKLVAVLAEQGGVRARVVRVPQALVTSVGAAGSLFHLLTRRTSALTLDKTRELLARHWTAQTSDSLRKLGLTQGTPFDEGVKITWRWYRDRGWIR